MFFLLLDEEELSTFVNNFSDCEVIRGCLMVLLTRKSIYMMCTNFKVEAKTYRSQDEHQ